MRAAIPRSVPYIFVSVFLIPVLGGVLGTVLPAMGYLPVLGFTEISHKPAFDFLTTPGLSKAVMVSLWTGLASTCLALALACVLVGGQRHAAFWNILHRIAPWLAMPHVAAAFGMAFLFAPSGWVVRVVFAPFFGWDVPPDWGTIRDPFGTSLMLGLALKETAYLALVMAAVLPRLDVDRRLAVAQSIGYSPLMGWMRCVFPDVYRRIRLPIFAVLSYSVGNVDMALVLGPQNPAPLAVFVLKQLVSSDLTLQLSAAFGAVMQFFVCGGVFLIWMCFERTVRVVCRSWMTAGALPVQRVSTVRYLESCLTKSVSRMFQIVLGLILLVLGVWSIAQAWFFPSVLPSMYTVSAWQSLLPLLVETGGITSVVAVASTVAALTLVLLALEAEHGRASKFGQVLQSVCYVPLLVPQIAFLFGFQVLLIVLNIEGTLLAVVWAHMVFVLPYIFLALSDTYAGLDVRYRAVSATLGRGPFVTWIRVVLPLLRAPILTAIAIGLAVSFAQYLSTVFAGAGRIETLTTEALALSSGGNRRVVGVLSLVLALLPLMSFMVLIYLSVRRHKMSMVSSPLPVGGRS